MRYVDTLWELPSSVSAIASTECIHATLGIWIGFSNNAKSFLMIDASALHV